MAGDAGIVGQQGGFADLGGDGAEAGSEIGGGGYAAVVEVWWDCREGGEDDRVAGLGFIVVVGSGAGWIGGVIGGGGGGEGFGDFISD